MKRRLLVGSYTTDLPHVAGHGNGIELIEFDPARPSVDRAGSVDGVNVSYLCRDPRSGMILAAEERVSYQGEPSGSVATYAPDGGTQFTLVDRCPTLGGGPVHVAVDETGTHAIVSNYYGGNLVVFDLHDGMPRSVRQVVVHYGSGLDPGRQEAPHPHSAYLHRGSDLVLVPDLGTDEIVVYRLDLDRAEPLVATGLRVPTAPGAGPRHIAPHPSEEWIFVVNELDSTVSAYAVAPDEAAVLAHVHTVAIAPPGFPTTAGEIAVHPSGGHVYASNRGHDSICELAWDSGSASLSVLGHFATGGRTPRHFALDPAGQYLAIANQDTDSLRIAEVRGDHRLRGLLDVQRLGSPACVLWL